MNIPKEVKIGGFNIPIKLDEKIGIEENKYGQYNVINHTIKICDKVAFDQQFNTLIHEIVEGMDSIYELKLEHKDITIIAAVFHQIIKDNPEIFKE
jgi:hypothetical protein